MKPSPRSSSSPRNRKRLPFVAGGSLAVLFFSLFLSGTIFKTNPPALISGPGFVAVTGLTIAIIVSGLAILVPKWTRAERLTVSGIVVGAVAGVGAWPLWYADEKQASPAPEIASDVLAGQEKKKEDNQKVVVHEAQRICTRAIKVVGNEKEWLFGNGLLELPKLYAVFQLYDNGTGEFLGTLTLPNGNVHSPMIIELEKATNLWKRPAG
jgi:hypothetical protein